MEYLTILQIYKLTDKEIIQYRKDLLKHKNNLKAELTYKNRGAIDEVTHEIKKRLERIKKEIETAQYDRENCDNSGYNESLLSIN